MPTYYIAVMNKVVSVLFDEIIYLSEKINTIDNLAAFANTKMGWDNASDEMKINEARELCNHIRTCYTEVLNKYSDKKEQ